jgi:hypothetical protein
MQEAIIYNEVDNYYLINNLIKIDATSIPNIYKKRNLNNLHLKLDGLWYYKEELLVKVLFNIEQYRTITFKNDDSNDYRFINLEIIYNNKYIFHKPENVIILKEYTPKLITSGAYSGQYRNMYWKVKDSNNIEYYIMHINETTYTKLSICSEYKILQFDNTDTRPCWYLNLNGYITSTIKINNVQKCVYFHQYIMNVHLENNTDMKKTVDHINRDKMDNRIENLRFANMSEQNSNRDKQKRQKQACQLPESIKDFIFPKYVTYNRRCYNKVKDSWREFFCIELHQKNNTVWASSKSEKVSLKDKFEQTLLKLKNINGEITDKQYKEKTNIKYSFPTGIRLILSEKYNNYIFILDKRIKDASNLNLKMVLTHNDLQLMIDKFISTINNKYPNNKFDEFKFDNPILLDFSTVSNSIIDETYEDSEDSEENITESFENIEIQPKNNCKVDNIDKFKKIPDLPSNFSLYIEKDCWYLSFNIVKQKIRYSKKYVLQCLCIQTELNRLINDINNDVKSSITIPNYTVQNPYGFINKTPLRYQSDKPILKSPFRIGQYNKKTDIIIFSIKIEGIKRTKEYNFNIDSYNLQDVLDRFIIKLNNEHNLNLERQIVDITEWKTTNKIK